jgi:hypothetical protein
LIALSAFGAEAGVNAAPLPWAASFSSRISGLDLASLAYEEI